MDPNNIHITDGVVDAGYSQVTTASMVQAGGGNLVIETSGADGEAGIIKISNDIVTASGNLLSLYAHSDVGRSRYYSWSGGLTVLAGWDGNLGTPDMM